MTLYFSDVYNIGSDDNIASARLDTNWRHMDIRVDALEGHQHDVTSNPHEIVTVTGAARYRSFAWTKGGAVAVTTGHVNRWRAPIALTISAVSAYVNTVSSSGAITIDIEKSTDNGVTWTSILSTRLTIDEGERDSATAATPAVISDSAMAVGDRLQAKVVNAGTGAQDLLIEAYPTYTITCTGGG